MLLFTVSHVLLLAPEFLAVPLSVCLHFATSFQFHSFSLIFKIVVNIFLHFSCSISYFIISTLSLFIFSSTEETWRRDSRAGPAFPPPTSQSGWKPFFLLLPLGRNKCNIVSTPAFMIYMIWFDGFLSCHSNDKHSTHVTEITSSTKRPWRMYEVFKPFTICTQWIFSVVRLFAPDDMWNQTKSN